MKDYHLDFLICIHLWLSDCFLFNLTDVLNWWITKLSFGYNFSLSLQVICLQNKSSKLSYHPTSSSTLKHCFKVIYLYYISLTKANASKKVESVISSVGSTSISMGLWTIARCIALLIWYNGNFFQK